MSAMAELDSIIREARAGSCSASCSSYACAETHGISVPRDRLLAQLVAIEASASRKEYEEAYGLDVPFAARHALQVENTLSSMVLKCHRVGACLACTLNPCICSQLPPLALSHRLWVVTHCKEVLRTTATGKLLLLAHPRATLLVSGWPAHDEELARVCSRPTAAVLFPSADAITPAALLERIAKLSPAAQQEESAATPAAAGAVVSPAISQLAPQPVLDILLLDGTWNQARQMFRTLPESVTKVVITPGVGSERSVFGTAVRKQGKQREEAGRISTLEAYAHLALDLGDPPAVVSWLSRYLERFIAAMPLDRPEEARKPLPNGELQPKTPTDSYRRRARGLGHQLGKGPMSEAGREVIGTLLRDRPQVNGVALHWRLSEDEAEAALIAKHMKREGADGESHIDRDVEVGRWPLALLVMETHGRRIWNRQKETRRARKDAGAAQEKHCVQATLASDATFT